MSDQSKTTGQQGYIEAFYELAALLDIPAMPISPAQAWRLHMLPIIERLRTIEKAALNVAETLNGGFIVCERCGDQESTTDIDYARELYQALGVQEKKHV